MRNLQRFLFAALVLVSIVHVGAGGYYWLLEGRRPYFDCLYRTIMIVSTVNEPWDFERELGIDDPELVRTLRQFTMVLLIGGMGLLLYTVTTLAALVIEVDLNQVRKRKARKLIENLRGHLIICGGGETGDVLLSELQMIGEKFLVVEINPERAAHLREARGVVTLCGDATEDDVLQEAGISEARGIIAALPGDKENLFVVITARQLNQGIKIVTRSIDPHTDAKLRHAGADFVVAPNAISANRMVSAMVRPHVVTFMDALLRDSHTANRVEEVRVQPGSPLAGKTLAESRIGQETGLLILALRGEHDESFRVNPPAGERLEAGMLLVVLGDVSRFGRLRELAGIIG